MNPTTEHWKPVPGFPGYQVSDHGRVRNPQGKIKQPHSWGCGHRYVALYRSGKRVQVAVARLVLALFDREPEPGEVARHFPDPDPANNRIDNLRWGTFQQNMDDRWHHGTVATCKLTEADVRTIRELHRFGAQTKHLAVLYKLTTSAISAAITRRTWRHVP